jgi:hypothetical protein
VRGAGDRERDGRERAARGARREEREGGAHLLARRAVVRCEEGDSDRRRGVKTLLERCVPSSDARE